MGEGGAGGADEYGGRNGTIGDTSEAVGGSAAASWETAYTPTSAGTSIELYTGNASNAK